MQALQISHETQRLMAYVLGVIVGYWLGYRRGRNK